MAVVRFKYRNASPPGGVYEYSLNGETVSDRSRIEISRKATRMRIQAGLLVFGDGFPHVMEYMCPSLPNGFCTAPSTGKSVNPAEVKRQTSTLFGMRLLPVDEIERREEICRNCPSHQRRGFCPTCTGLHQWVYNGFRGQRPKIPQDIICGACAEDLFLVVASASVADLPPTPGANYPEGCWRIQKEA